nr:tail fiber domain-containing protein [uncultured Dyadobacter sp.]
MKNWYKLTGALLLLTCIGKRAGAQTHYGQGAGTQGLGHSFFGADAGKVNAGSFNTFFGQQTGASNSTGMSNTYVGYNAGFGGAVNSKNTFVGTEAGYNCTGNYNTITGAHAGHSSLGNMNVFIGFEAALNSVQGSNNTFLGAGAGLNNNADLNTFVGYRAGYLNDKGTSNTFVGNEAGYLNSVGESNAFIGVKAGFANNDGKENVFLGYLAGSINTKGEKNTYLGYSSGGNPTLINATAIGANAFATADNCLILGYKANVGIGISAPAFQLHLSSDDAAKAGSPDWIVASDSRLKKNITDFTDGLDLLKQIKPVWFQYNGKAGIETGDKKFVGIIAQEMQKIAPYTIGTFNYQDSLGNKTEYLDYDANAVTYILINSVKEQQQVIEEKDARIAALEKNQLDLMARLEVLEQNRPSSATDFQKPDQTRDVPYLEQNVPNGFSSNTSIRYYIPEFVKAATMNIYNSKGVKIDTRAITARGKGEMIFSAESLQRGVLLYELMVDGKSVGGKKMLIE